MNEVGVIFSNDIVIKRQRVIKSPAALNKTVFI